MNNWKTAAGAAAMLCAGSAMAVDVVIDWNNQLLNSIAATGTPPPKASRAMAMVQTAVYDAVNSVNPTHRGYNAVYANPAGTSAEAAAAQAARDVLVQLYPGRAAIFDAQLAASLSQVPDGAGKMAGISLGSQSAAGILARRANDNSSLVISYTPGTNPGQWRPTAPANAPALLPNWKYVTPFAMSSGAQFRPAAPPSVTSQEYTDSYNEVKAYGRATGSLRTQEQTDIANMWAAGGGTVTPPGQWNQVAQQLAISHNLSTAESARLFALLGIADADAAIAAWDCKYTYNYWRPITGINQANSDGNPDTAQDASWTPLLATPPFPAYISGHSTFSAASAAVLASFFGSDSQSFSVTSVGITRSFTSLLAAAQEAGQSRIYGGIHWQFDNQIGLHCGTEVGQLVADTQLTVPAPGTLVGVAAAGLFVRRRRR